MVTVSHSRQLLSLFGGREKQIKRRGKVYLRGEKKKIAPGTLLAKHGGKGGTGQPRAGAQHLCLGWFPTPAKPWPNQRLAPTQRSPRRCRCQHWALLGLSVAPAASSLGPRGDGAFARAP